MNLKAQKNIFQIPEAEKYLSAILPRLAEKRVKSFTTITLALLTLSFFGIFAISPTLSTIADLQKQISDSEFVNQQLRQKITNLTLLQDSYKKIQNSLPVLYNAVPANPDATVLVGQLQTIAQNSHVTLIHIQTLAVDVGSSPTTQFGSFAFAIDISGTYANIKTFLQTLTSFNRLITLDALSLTKSTANDNIYSLSLRGRAYFKTQ